MESAASKYRSALVYPQQSRAHKGAGPSAYAGGSGALKRPSRFRRAHQTTGPYAISLQTQRYHLLPLSNSLYAPRVRPLAASSDTGVLAARLSWSKMEVPHRVCQ